MKFVELDSVTAPASSVILGLMRIEPLDDQQIRTLVGTAMDAGVTVFDHADIYGTERHACERRFGGAVSFTASQREQVMLQSKVGIRDGFYDFSSRHILDTVDESLDALRTDHLDLLLLHRPDTLMEPAEVAAAFDTLQSAGKVRAFGVSNHTPGQIELLKTAVTQPLVANQVQLSVTHAPLIAAGVAANIAGLDQSVSRDNGLLDYSRVHGMTLQAWSPFQKGTSDGVFLGDRENYAELNDVLDELATEYGVTPTGIATAWITRHPANIQVVLGTTTPSRVSEAAAGSDVDLTRAQWYRIFRAAGHTLP
ncbi:aldo/keto reductase [Williamsia phyllosphaerae]|uniref:Aldo/keto reductase n=1 Tax=Williamsia phyllosphaerae TaxID=885042 RepID=A0ABQ1UI03_9NOCA|nr:aldo/keto reductase [Williamsia phyllosphaerae]GGF19094.1 aldo/keto reductase [Williamsia phyllosphaerae]